MAKTLYDLMDWPEIETITYSESDDPHAILGPHKISQGLLVQAFLPEAEKVVLKLDESGREYPMELVEEPGFFAVLLPKKSKPVYTLLVTDKNGRQTQIEDPYRFEPVWEQTEIQKFTCGIYYKVYEKMGAIPMTIDGVDGVLFSVWAPNAVRVSVIGMFNHWDGRVHQMRRLGDCGIFELFIPGIKAGSEYKFELKLKGNHMSIKTDPYAHAVGAFPEANGIVQNPDGYSWQDAKWMTTGRNGVDENRPFSAYELHLGSFMPAKEDGSFPSYRELAKEVCAHVKKMGYTHVLLLPLTEYMSEESSGYHTFGYYAPTRRYGSPDDLKYFIDYLHRENIGVLMEWAPIFFETCDTGLRAFDGTFLYEHMDERRGYHRREQGGIFNYAREEVTNFLIANALYWLDKFHLDGLMVHKTDALLYLDYNKDTGEWLPNMYGGNENLDGVEFLKHLNSIIRKNCAGCIMIADDKSGWKGMTRPVEEDALGFDLKLNHGWTQGILSYMELDPLFRRGSYYDMLMSMVYAYTDKFALPVTQDYMRGTLGSMYKKMPGSNVQKINNLKVLYGYMMTHPGKKVLFMGQDYGEPCAWKGTNVLQTDTRLNSPHKELEKYVSAWNTFYKKHPALYKMDFSEDGFEWINQISADENIIVFVRKTDKKEDTLLVVCNFVPVEWENYKIGVPYPGRYKEVFNSDAAEYGGSGYVNPRVKTAKADECDAREYSIRIRTAPLSISVFQYSENDKPAGRPETSLKNALKQKIEEAEKIGDVEKQARAAKAVEENRRKRR